MKMILAIVLLIVIKCLLIAVALVDRMTFGREAPLGPPSLGPQP